MKRKSRKSAKKRALKKIKSVERIRTEAAVKEANRRIKVIERAYPDGKYTWGITKLKNTIPKYMKDNQVYIPKGASYVELIDIRKSTMKFISSRVSTKKGIEDIKRRTLTTFARNYSDYEDEEEAYQDAERFYKMYEDEPYAAFVRLTGIRGSELDIIINKIAKPNNYSENQFMELLEMYVTIVDEDIRTIAKYLYDTYVRN